MKAKKVIISILIVVISVLLGSTNVLAHPTKATVSGCEDVGWLEMENRHNKNTIIGYKFDSSAYTKPKTKIRLCMGIELVEQQHVPLHLINGELK